MARTPKPRDRTGCALAVCLIVAVSVVVVTSGLV